MGIRHNTYLKNQWTHLLLSSANFKYEGSSIIIGRCAKGCNFFVKKKVNFTFFLNNDFVLPY